MKIFDSHGNELQLGMWNYELGIVTARNLIPHSSLLIPN